MNIDQLKNTFWASAGDAVKACCAWHLALYPCKCISRLYPKDQGSRVTLVCVDEDCTFILHLKLFRKAAGNYWRLVSTRDHERNENLTHNVFGCQRKEASPKLAAKVLQHTAATGETLVKQARAMGLHIGKPGEVTGYTPQNATYISRVLQEKKVLNSATVEAKIRLLPSLLKSFEDANPGAFCSLQHYATGELRRLVIIDQWCKAAYKSGFLRKLFAIDGGFYPYKEATKYKLICIVATDGDNKNISVAISIADGETADNITWIFDELLKNGIDINCPDVVTISDEGAGILKALKERVGNAKHITCLQHWMGNLESSQPHAYSLTWDALQADNSKDYTKALSDLKEAYPVCFKKLMDCEFKYNLSRFLRLGKQQRQDFPPTFEKKASNAEQEMAKWKAERSMHPAEAVVSITERKSNNYATRYAQFNTFKADSTIPHILTTYATMQYIELIEQASTRECVAFDIVNQIFKVTNPATNRIHMTNWRKRTCTDCAGFWETLMPCIHLVSTLLTFKKKGMLYAFDNAGNNPRLIETREGGDGSVDEQGLKYLFGKCYWFSTMETTFAHCSPVVPVTWSSCSYTVEDENMAPKLKLLPSKETKKCGKAQSVRIASSMDHYRTGRKPTKRAKMETSGVNISEKVDAGVFISLHDAAGVVHKNG
jgi:hypothetical protein